MTTITIVFEETLNPGQEAILMMAIERAQKYKKVRIMPECKITIVDTAQEEAEQRFQNWEAEQRLDDKSFDEEAD